MFSGEGVELDLDSLSDADGLGNISVIWQSDGQNIKDASGTKLFLTEDLIDTRISAQVNYRDKYGTLEEFVITSDVMVSSRPGELERQERIIGLEVNSPESQENHKHKSETQKKTQISGQRHCQMVIQQSSFVMKMT